MLKASSFGVAVSVLTLLGGFSACSHKAVVPDDSGHDSSPAQAAINSDSPPSSDLGNAYGLQTVHFGYDSSSLSSEAKGALKTNARIMKDNTSLRIQIEGHCDQRGGIQYNIALGEKRANAAKLYLEDLGVPSVRLATISYGKEHPLDTSDSEAAYAKNRRANFVITKSMADSR